MRYKSTEIIPFPPPHVLSRNEEKQDQDVVEDRRRATKAMRDAVSNQQAKRRRQDAAAKVAEDLSALYDGDPQLPGKQGGTQAILERLTPESRGWPSSAIKACSLKPSKNSEGEQLASQMGKNLLRQETVGRISKWGNACNQQYPERQASGLLSAESS